MSYKEYHPGPKCIRDIGRLTNEWNQKHYKPKTK